MQAGILIAALANQGPLELGKAFADAWDVGPKWREHLESGIARLADEERKALTTTLTLVFQFRG